MLHILVVEDDDFFREMLIDMLELDGHRVDAAEDGAKALLLLNNIQPELIITDMMMPNMTGAEFIHALAKRDKTIPFIVMSGGRLSHSAAINAQSDAELGIKESLTKPFSRQELRQAISGVMASACL